MRVRPGECPGPEKKGMDGRLGDRGSKSNPLCFLAKDCFQDEKYGERKTNVRQRHKSKNQKRTKKLHKRKNEKGGVETEKKDEVKGKERDEGKGRCGRGAERKEKKADRPMSHRLEGAPLCCSWEGRPARVVNVAPGRSQFGSLGPPGTKGMKGHSSSPGPPSQAAMPEGAERWFLVTGGNAGQVGPEHRLPPLPPHPTPRPAAISAVNWVLVRRWVIVVGAGQAGGSGQRHRASRPRTGQKWFPSLTTGQSSQPPGGEGRPGEDALAQRQGRRRAGAPQDCGREGCTHPAAGDAGLAHLPPVPSPGPSPFAMGLAATDPGALRGWQLLAEKFLALAEAEK